ncbi:phosphotransferase [endosymbiont of unidentified scaly snail isolate Monju]|uniref:phosphotransferase n=1 Tax=endosymbiont of unidentified scaly snail isolate Monju TaxID=1248727 RepID=UPI0005B9AFB7|nr:phosphotransferase [endosymbiont of unidentified scaly snail isolate Monju]
MAALSREADALRHLENSEVSDQVPRLMDFVQSGGQAAIHQSYRRRRPLDESAMHREVLAFLGRLADIDRKERRLADVMQQQAVVAGIHWCEARGMAGTVLRRLRHLCEEDIRVTGHRSHGDFAPWNCAWTDAGLFVFDWEESREWELLLADAFYYAVAPSLHIRSQKERLEVLSERALALHGKAADHAGIEPGNNEIHWALWLLRQLGLQPKPLYGDLLGELERSWQKTGA